MGNTQPINCGPLCTKWPVTGRNAESRAKSGRSGDRETNYKMKMIYVLMSGGQDGLGHKCGVAVSQSFKFILNSSTSTPENPSGPTAVAE